MFNDKAFFLIITLSIVLFVSTRFGHALYTEQEESLLPVLFHLDNYDRCMSQPNSIYCLGEYDLAPVGKSLTFEIIKKHTSKCPNMYDRSKLYRGYCVSARCPSAEKNASLRFEHCVDTYTHRYALSARLHKLHYCTTGKDRVIKARQPPDSAQQLFLRVVYAILALNVIGTFYDIVTGNSDTKIGIITAWSVRASWRRLTAVYDDGDPRLNQLTPIHGIRVFVLMIAMYTHTGVQFYQFYVTNPRFLDLLLSRIDGTLLTNGSSLIQMFVMISSFLTAYNLYIYSEKHNLSLYMIPGLLIKRIIRVAPVLILLVSFNATYGYFLRPGVFSPILEQDNACRRKFWAHVLFLNNVLDKQDNDCLMPAWSLSVDMQLFVVSSALTIIMLRRKKQALRVYSLLFIVSAITCGIVSYIMGYRSIIYETVPDKLRGLYKNSPSFGGYYTSSWGSTPACFMGLILAHQYYELQQAKHDWNQNKWFKRLLPWIVPFATILTISMGMFFRQYTQPWVSAFYLTVERPFFVTTVFCVIIGCLNIDSSRRRFFAWSGWRIPARLSLPVMLCHWIVSEAITSRPHAYYVSSFYLGSDYFAVVFYSYIIALPISLLVEIPVQRFFYQLF